MMCWTKHIMSPNGTSSLTFSVKTEMIPSGNKFEGITFGNIKREIKGHIGKVFLKYQVNTQFL